LCTPKQRISCPALLIVFVFNLPAKRQAGHGSPPYYLAFLPLIMVILDQVTGVAPDANAENHWQLIGHLEAVKQCPMKQGTPKTN